MKLLPCPSSHPPKHKDNEEDSDVVPQGCILGYAHSHSGRTVVWQGSLSFWLTDHTHLWSSTNYWWIPLLFVKYPGDKLLHTSPIKFSLFWMGTSWSYCLKFIHTAGRLFQLFFVQQLVGLLFSLYLQWIYQSPPNCLIPKLPLFLKVSVRLNFMLCYKWSWFLWGEILSCLFYGLLLFPGKNLWATALVLGEGTIAHFSLSDTSA